MLAFRINPIREYGHDRRLTAAGVSWNEQSIGVCTATGFAWLAAGALVAAGLAVRYATGRGFYFVAAGIFLGWTSWVWLMARGRRVRCVIFEGDGRIATPCGIPGGRSLHTIGLRWENLRSIEYTQFNNGFLVRMFGADGRIWIVAHPTARDEAHHVVVQLLLALQEMRDAAGRPATPEDRAIA
jgi:hypothetical protein